MEEPSRTTSRHWLAGVALAALALVAAGFALGRASVDKPVPAPPPTQPIPVDVPPPPIAEATLGRADLIRGAAAAADAFAGGEQRQSAPLLAGRRFELRLPFGCDGSEHSDAPLRWRYDEAARTLRLHAEPMHAPVEEWIGAPEAREAVDAIEGFWIERPWTSSEECPTLVRPAAPAPAPTPSPTPTPQADPAAPTQPTLGIGQIFTSQGSRLGRRNGDAYETVVKRDALDLSRGLRLRLRGRIGAAPDGSTTLCRAGRPGQPPQCLIVIELGEVAIEDPVTGETLAQWDVSTQSGGVAID